MNVDDKTVVGDSGEEIARLGAGTDEGESGVCDGTGVAGSGGALAAVIGGVAVATQGTSVREILTA